ncbi:Hfi1 protein [Maudiozyma humilis]|uniref:Hfi1 protein n=1 Tax=Maudiozyma humilis TaxID=51915 RepID=A0AAV5RX23_MAUHU|nr:Hfi1 protein [Kazachstania humilis]
MSAIQQQTKSVATSYSANMTPADSTGITNLRPVTVKADPAAQASLELLNIDGKNQRLDLGSMIEEFMELLGKDNWTKYSQLISRFILGKLSRKELSREFDTLFGPPLVSQSQDALSTIFPPIKQDDETASSTTQTETSPHVNRMLRPRLIRLHNQLLLGIFTNSMRDSPLGASGKSWGFGSNMANKGLKRVNKHNSQIETYKKIVMSLPLSDRNRLKGIRRDAGKQGFIYCSVQQDRLTNVPKIPIVTNPDTLKRVKANNLKTPIEWAQDILNGYNAPLATDNFSLPDTDSLYLKMTSIAREHGLVGNVDARCVDLTSIALDHYLKKIVEFGIDCMRYRTKKYSDYFDINDDGIYTSMAETKRREDTMMLSNTLKGIRDDDDKMDVDSVDETKDEAKAADAEEVMLPKLSLTNEDIFNAMSIFPNLMKSSTSVQYNLYDNGLKNDNELVEFKSTIDDLPLFSEEKPMFTPVDDKNIGSREELSWLIKDILTEK